MSRMGRPGMVAGVRPPLCLKSAMTFALKSLMLIPPVGRPLPTIARLQSYNAEDAMAIHKPGYWQAGLPRRRTRRGPAPVDKISGQALLPVVTLEHRNAGLCPPHPHLFGL